MSTYNGPLRDMRFAPHEVFDAPASWARLPRLAKATDRETSDAILDEAAKGADVTRTRRTEDESLHGTKLALADFFFRRLLPRTQGLEACIRVGSAPCPPFRRSSFNG